MIFYGTKASQIGALDISNSRCDHCGTSSTQHVSLFGKYAHVYWIPFFPLSKVAVAECANCKRTIPEKEFSEQLNTKLMDYKSEFKRPFWHWSGLGIVGLLISMMFIIDTTKTVDPRSVLLEADVKQLSQNPNEATDSLSYLLKAFFNDFANEETDPGSFEFFSRVDGNKILVLMKIPSLKSIKKEEREKIVTLIERLIDSDDALKDKEKYIGVHGKYNFMVLKTPAGLENRNLLLDNALYEFYGPKAEAVQ